MAGELCRWAVPTLLDFASKDAHTIHHDRLDIGEIKVDECTSRVHPGGLSRDGSNDLRHNVTALLGMHG